MEIAGRLTKAGNDWVSELPFVDIMSQGNTEIEAISAVIEATQELFLEQYSLSLEVRLAEYGRSGYFTVFVNLSEADVMKKFLAFALKRQIENSEDDSLSYRKLAEEMGTRGPNSVYQYTTGLHEPGFSKLQALFSAMGKEIVIDVRDKKLA